MKRHVGAAMAFVLAGAQARAEVLDDYLAAGYHVLAQTSIAGSFTGCRPKAMVTFTDGSRFICGHVSAQASYDARVYVLAQPGDRPSVVLIGSRPCAGSVVQLAGRALSHSAPTSDEPPPAASSQITAGQKDVRIIRVESIKSVNALQSQASKRLNDVQADPLPPRGPVPHK